MKRFLILFAIYFATLGVFCYSAEFRRARTFEDAFQASCRVSVANARGSGTFIGKDKEKNRCIILTNYHVVTSNNTATLDFWTNGIRQTVSGKVFARFYDAKRPYDFALIEVDPYELSKINPPFVALGGQGASPDQNSYILSSGCPKGRFAQAWKGKVLGYYNGATIMFQPGPVPGQSGSGVLSEVDDQLWLTGVLTWLIGNEGADDSKGGAIPIANLYEALKGQQNASTNDNVSPIPPEAVECAERLPYVVEFTRNQCPECVKAEQDVELLRQSSIHIDVINTSLSQEAIEQARFLSVVAAPTFIVYDENGVEKSRYIGSGKARAIASDVDELIKLMNVKKAPVRTEDPPNTKQIEDSSANTSDSQSTIPAPSASQDDSDDLPCFIQGVIKSEDAQYYGKSFRNRPPVYEYELGTSGNVGFFEDSNSRWQNRNRSNSQKQEEQDDLKQNTPQIEEGKLRDRLWNKSSGIIGNNLNGTINEIEKRIEKKADSKIAELKKYIVYQIDKNKTRFIVFAFLLVFTAALCAEGFKNIITRVCQKFWKGLRVFIIAFEDAAKNAEKRVESEDNSKPDNLYVEQSKTSENASNTHKNSK